jgi:hypothetical protein
MTDELKKLITQAEWLEERVHELGSIRATLEVNCQPGHSLHKHGCEYSPDKTIHDNMFSMLKRLSDLLDGKK